MGPGMQHLILGQLCSVRRLLCRGFRRSWELIVVLECGRVLLVVVCLWWCAGYVFCVVFWVCFFLCNVVFFGGARKLRRVRAIFFWGKGQQDTSEMQRQVFEWKDERTDAVGWVVIDCVINGTAGGGIFMHKNATKEETQEIAANMSKKFTVTSPQIGGAKAGIRFDPKDPRAHGVLKRFLLDQKVLLKNVWNTAGDLNTNDAEIERIIQEDLGLPTCQHALSCRIAEHTGENLASQLAILNQTPANPFFPLIEGAVGYGLAASIKWVLDMLPITRCRVLIQGFGTVGSSLALYLETRNIATVVGIADKDGFLHNANGLPICELLQLRKNSSIKGKDSAKTIIEHLGGGKDSSSFGTVVMRGERSDADFFKEFLSCERAEIICPCAGRYQVTPQIVDVLCAKTWAAESDSDGGSGDSDGESDGKSDGKAGEPRFRMLAAGANNCLSVTGDTEDCGIVAGMLRKANVCVIPDYVCNSGTAQLFHVGLSRRFDMNPVNVEEVLEACAEPITDFLRSAMQSVERDGKQWTRRLPDLAAGCYRLSETRLRHPCPIPINEPVRMHVTDKKEQAEAMSDDERERHLKRLVDLCANCTEIEELRELIGTNFTAYDGFEPSGRMHVAQALYKKALVNAIGEAGGTFILWVADIFAALNNKQDGDMEKIRLLGEYFIEIWKSCGMNMQHVRIQWAFEEIMARPQEYLARMVDIATKTSIARVHKCITITGKKESDDNVKFSQLLYVLMQCSDIFFIDGRGVDVCQLGVDQDKVNMLARDYLPANAKKPVILSHTMLPGLKKGQEKMSKSDPSSCLYVQDDAETIANKIKAAFCEEGVIEGNPCVSYMRWCVFTNYPQGVDFCDSKTQQQMHCQDYAAFETAYKAKAITPQELKKVLTNCMNHLLDSIRDHFQKDAHARDILRRVNECIK